MARALAAAAVLSGNHQAGVPTVLRRHQPQRWRGEQLVTSLSPIACTGLQSCSLAQTEQSKRTRLRSVRVYAATGSTAEADTEAESIDLGGEAIAEDYYSILGLTPQATGEEIKAAYYSCMKACHPDLSNGHPDSVAFCSFINEVYEVLGDPEMRAVYDEIKGYSLTAVNPFMDVVEERDQVFVDEFTCIGCKNCANTAEATFGIEDIWGRARVFNQRGDPEWKIQEAVDTCPVSCIHRVSAAQLALLEDEMRRMERVDVGIMRAGQGARGGDVFTQASWRWEKRRRLAETKARARAASEKRKAQGGSGWWGGDPLWGNGDAESSTTGEAEEPQSARPDREMRKARPSKEKMEKAAAAARRWREYSRRGVDRRRGLVIAEQATSGNSREVGAGQGKGR